MKQARLPEATPRPIRLCFVSYRHLSDLAVSTFADYAGRAEIEVVEASFRPAVLAAQAREQAGRVDAFVSAGSNAALLREAVASPVATIKANGYDILLALLRARASSARVGVLTFGETIPELERVKELLNIDVAQLAYRTPDEARDCLHRLAAEGRQVIVGSSIVVEMAGQHGLQGILAYSLASVRQGIEDAIEMGRVARLESARNEQVHAVLHNLQEAVLSVDHAQRITAANSAMAALLGAAPPALRGRALHEVAPGLAMAEVLAGGEGEHGIVLPFGGRDWIANRTPLRDGARITGAVLALYDAAAIERADARLRTQRRGRRAAGARYTFADLRGDSPAMQRALDAARRHAATDLGVLVTGESGSGKELFAQALHHASARGSRPFVALNCSALPETLLESELFGHEEGAFTGARRGGKAGLFEAAHTGTLFLDEIGDMPLALQSRLLRVLQEREVVRVGGTVAVPVDVRIVAATHRPLREMIAQGTFRADLYYRLNLLQLRLPPLRERGADLEVLALAALHRRLAQLKSPLDPRALLQRVLPLLRRYAWPGNVRELENVCDRIAVCFAPLASVAEARLEDLLFECPELALPETQDGDDRGGGPGAAHGDLAVEAAVGSAAAKSTQAVQGTQGAQAAQGTQGTQGTQGAQAAQMALQSCGGSRARAAAQLGISRSTLWRWLRSGEAEAGVGAGRTNGD